MATIKAFSNLEQSKKLAEILPLESADMYYTPSLIKGHTGYFPHLKRKLPIDWDIEQAIPCWSLAALLEVMPEIQGGKPIIALDDNYITYPHMRGLHTKAESLVDACVAMIEKLNEQNLL